MPAAKKPPYKNIHEAIKNADASALAAMVKEGASVNELDDTKDRFTPTHWACYKGALECLHWLLWHGADATVATPKGWTPAHIAAIRGQDACLQALANNGVNLTARDLRGSTPLHMAAAHGNSFAIQTLLRAGVDVGAVDKNGWTSVHYAAFHGRLGCLQPLMRWGGSSDETDSLGNTAVHLAAMEGHLPCLKFMVGEAHSSLHVLSARNNNGDTPKLLAVQFYKQTVVDYINNVEWETEHPEEAENLAFPAHVAAYSGDLSHLRMLVENQIVNLNERDDKGATPAHKAAGQGHLDILQWLVEMGADMKIKNHAGETPKDVARRFARLAALRLLGDEGSEDEGVGADDDEHRDRKKGKKKSGKKRDKKLVEKIIGSDGEEEEIEIDDDGGSSGDDSGERAESRGRAKKKMEKLEALLEIATKNYLQLGGTVREKEQKRMKEEREMRRRIAELESLLEAERSRREKLEARIDQYKIEVGHLTAQLREHSQSANEDDSHGERAVRKKKVAVKKRSTSKDGGGTFVHRKGNFKIV